jgi:predicted O-methyltransferase YrrM
MSPLPIRSRFTHFVQAKRKGHGVHSPFVFELATKVFPPQQEEDFSDHPAEDWRTECSMNNAFIDVTDFGTGASGKRKISSIVNRAAKSPREGQLLYRLVQHFRPEKMLELGTSLGVTTLYEASANRFEKFISLEGCPQTAALAKTIFAKNNFDVDVRVGEFSSTLAKALKDLGETDFVYFDGNHREKPTLDYFEACLPYAHAESVFVFDDIHWSEEMESAWEKIKANDKVKLTIDVFHFGLVFFREENKEKEHFRIKV